MNVHVNLNVHGSDAASAAEPCQHRNDAFQDFGRTILRFGVDDLEHGQDVHQSGALHRGATRNRIGTRDVCCSRAARRFRYVEGNRAGSAPQLIQQCGVSLRNFIRNTLGQSNEFDGAPVYVEFLEAEHPMAIAAQPDNSS
ncbi:MAG TPA: hypothetical protein VFE76_13530 [Myxococcales bacterium]|nr:hypothetical protein [Myxococcales bacterium]